jgi:hypothetical protein
LLPEPLLNAQPERKPAAASIAPSAAVLSIAIEILIRMVILDACIIAP